MGNDTLSHRPPEPMYRGSSAVVLNGLRFDVDVTGPANCECLLLIVFVQCPFLKKTMMVG
jgi:hypothetical protein